MKDLNLVLEEYPWDLLPWVGNVFVLDEVTAGRLLFDYYKVGLNYNNTPIPFSPVMDRRIFLPLSYTEDLDLLISLIKEKGILEEFVKLLYKIVSFRFAIPAQYWERHMKEHWSSPTPLERIITAVILMRRHEQHRQTLV